MFNFLSGLYERGFGRYDTKALYDAPHAQIARAMVLMPRQRDSLVDLLQYSTSPGFDVSS